MANVTKRGNTYRIRVSCGYDINGKQIIKSTTWTPETGMTAKQIAKELERQKVLFEEKCMTGQVLDGSIKFADFAEQWFKDYAEKQLRKRTIIRYRTLTKRTYAAIGHIRLDKLQPHHLIEFYNNLQEAGIREDVHYQCAIDIVSAAKSRKMNKGKLAEAAGISPSTIKSICKGNNVTLKSAQAICNALNIPLKEAFKPVGELKKLSTDTIRYYHRFISTVLSTAVQWQVILSNPCERVRPPKPVHAEPRYLDEKQAAIMIQSLENEAPKYKVAIMLLLYTGLRRGELCGLEWKDIDFKSQLLHIQRTSAYIPKIGITEEDTKNQSSRRVIKISDAAIDMLKSFKSLQAKQRLSLGDQWHDYGKIFTTWNGEPMHPDTLSIWFRSFIEKNSLPNITLHSLRHTNATLLIASGVNLRTVSNRLGHSQTSTTANIYSHAIKSADEAAAETLQNILNPMEQTQTV